MKTLQSKGLSQREACAIVKARRRSSREMPSDRAQSDAQWATRLTEVAHAHAEHGCRRVYEDYERDAIAGDEYMNYKRFRRIYRLANLQIGRRVDAAEQRSYVASRSSELRNRLKAGPSTSFMTDYSTAAHSARLRSKTSSVGWVLPWRNRSPFRADCS